MATRQDRQRKAVWALRTGTTKRAICVLEPTDTPIAKSNFLRSVCVGPARSVQAGKP